MQSGWVNVLFIGDVVGQPGRRVITALLPGLRARWNLAMVIANGENSAGGSGITPATAQDLYDAGVDVITSGDHLWDQREVSVLLEGEPRFLRPANYPEGTPGQGSRVYHLPHGPPVAVLNIQGTTFMACLENPFHCAQAAVTRLRETTPIIILDIHAEATSEKQAMGRLLDGQVSAVLGTHTHVQTADDQIFPRGTAFLCDAGFTGPHESILGREIEPVLQRFLSRTPRRFKVARGQVRLQGALIDIDESTGHARSIQRVSELWAQPGPEPSDDAE